jgi:hypothetical protein
MTKSLLELYGAATSQDLARWIRDEYGVGTGRMAQNKHRVRREEIARRVRLYRDDADGDFEAVVRRVFEDAEVREQRIRLIEVAKEQNVTSRIVNEVASLYDQPAVRTFPNEAEQVRFDAEEKRLNLHEIMQELQRMLQLCNDVLVWQYRGVEDKTKLRIVTPDLFDAIPDPRDQTEMAGVLLDVCPLAITPNRGALPHYELWDAVYCYQLNASGEVIATVAHELGRIPGVLLHRRQPTDRLLDARPGRDITSAHLGTGLLNLMIMRLSKSQGERQPILKGNLAGVAKNQRMDGESPMALPPEVEAMMLDTKTDPDHYLAVKRDKIGSVAQTYGMSYEYVAYGQAAPSSGKEWEARHRKLKELRAEQRRRSLINEAHVIELVGFDAEGVKVDHTEQAAPQDAGEELDLLKVKLPLGLDSPIKYLMRKNPDLDRTGAILAMRENLNDWALVIAFVRSLNMPGDADANNPGRTPQQNGADNKPREAPPPAEDDKSEDNGAGAGDQVAS